MKVLLSKHDASEIVGIIFPFLPRHAERLLDDGKTVFVKFFGKGRIPLKLQPGSRLFPYESKGNKEIVGEAKILRVESISASDAMSVCGTSLFLTQSEFDDYVENRRGKIMLALILEDAKRYQVPLKLNKSATMAGQYMTREMYRKIRGESQKAINVKTES
jgi:hypothetical protein